MGKKKEPSDPNHNNNKDVMKKSCKRKDIKRRGEAKNPTSPISMSSKEERNDHHRPGAEKKKGKFTC